MPKGIIFNHMTLKLQRMKKIYLLIIAFTGFNLLQAQDLKAYQIYNKKETPVSFPKMIDQLDRYDVVLFGELHNNAIIHWLELKTTEALYQKKGGKLVLGAEMFERDNQTELNAYLSDSLDSEDFKEIARLWSNFKTDYKPLLDFAKDSSLNFIATNIPRRYAQLVAKNGLDTLSHIPDDEKQYIAQQPIKFSLKTPGYEEMKGFMKDHAGDHLLDFIKAQAIKDATMAESILQHRKRHQLFLHYNGNFHSKAYGGIYWQLKKQKPWLNRLKIAVITIGESADKNLPIPEDLNPTEFNIIVPKDMTKTY